jgi:hypothetical protein
VQSSLPELCVALAESLKRVRATLRLRKRPIYDTAVAILVRHVQETTGKPGDEEVATLIGFAINKSEYDAATLKTWRKEHLGLLSPDVGKR